MSDNGDEKKIQALKNCVDDFENDKVSLPELKDNIKISLSDVPTTITVEQLQKLKDHINNRFNGFDANGNLDLDKCQRNIAYSISNWFNNYNGLLLKERQKLGEIEGELALAKAQAYDNIKMSDIKYDVDTKGMGLILEGHKLVLPKKIERDKQKAYTQFLENAVKQIGYYANGVKIMIMREDQKHRYAQ